MRLATFGYFSVFIFTSFTWSFPTAAATAGKTLALRIWHGPHHVA